MVKASCRDGSIYRHKFVWQSLSSRLRRDFLETEEKLGVTAVRRKKAAIVAATRGGAAICASTPQGTTRSMSSKNSRLRVFFVDRFRPRPIRFMLALRLQLWLGARTAHAKRRQRCLRRFARGRKRREMSRQQSVTANVGWAYVCHPWRFSQWERGLRPPAAL